MWPQFSCTLTLCLLSWKQSALSPPAVEISVFISDRVTTFYSVRAQRSFFLRLLLSHRIRWPQYKSDYTMKIPSKGNYCTSPCRCLHHQSGLMQKMDSYKQKHSSTWAWGNKDIIFRQLVVKCFVDILSLLSREFCVILCHPPIGGFYTNIVTALTL